MDVLEIAEGRVMIDVVQGESMKTLNVTMLLAVSCCGVAFALRVKVTSWPIKSRLLDTTSMLRPFSETPKLVASVGSDSVYVSAHKAGVPYSVATESTKAVNAVGSIGAVTTY